MNREINVDSIPALDAEIIRLKHTWNSLLSIVRIPPEILGYILRFNIATETSDPDFAGVQKSAQNFLFASHHRYKVTCCTPGLWNS